MEHTPWSTPRGAHRAVPSGGAPGPSENFGDLSFMIGRSAAPTVAATSQLRTTMPSAMLFAPAFGVASHAAAAAAAAAAAGDLEWSCDCSRAGMVDANSVGCAEHTAKLPLTSGAAWNNPCSSPKRTVSLNGKNVGGGVGGEGLFIGDGVGSADVGGVDVVKVGVYDKAMSNSINWRSYEYHTPVCTGVAAASTAPQAAAAAAAASPPPAALACPPFGGFPFFLLLVAVFPAAAAVWPAPWVTAGDASSSIFAISG